MSFDLSALDTTELSDSGVEMVVRHPSSNTPLLDDSGSAVTITLAGPDSRAFKAIHHKNSNRRLKMAASRGGVKVTAEEIEVENLEMLAKCTLGWHGIGMDGEPLKYSVENAMALYRRFPWVKEQVDEFIGDRSNFIKS